MTARRVSAPFSIDARMPRRGQVVEFVLAISGKKRDAELQDLQEVLTEFVIAANYGMFAGKGFDPASSSLELAVKTDVRSPGLHYHGRATAVDVGAYSILLRMLVRTHFADERVAHVSLESLKEGRDDLGAAELLGKDFPGHAPKLPFQLSIDKNFSGNDEPIVRVAFKKKLTDEDFDSINKMITSWETVVILGGYALALDRRADDQLIPGELYLAAPSVVETTIAHYDAPVAAYDALISGVLKSHTEVASVKNVDFE